MVRVDELYQNIFWPYIAKHRPGTRLFYCDPPGSTEISSVLNFGFDDREENNYIFMHDQEPIHANLHTKLFEHIVECNHDIWPLHAPKAPGHVIVSEKGEFVKWAEETYNWQSSYYFYHGWAAQDWYRGYDKTFLIPRARDRKPTTAFIMPNRIVAGQRDHRVLLLYHLFKSGIVTSNWVSAPRICPYENISIETVAAKYQSRYNDITEVFAQADLPILFPGEDSQVMSSCWLTNFNESADSAVYVVSETVFFGNRLHLTEKTFKPIALEMPFVLLAPAHSLEYLRSYGFRTFASVFDESYDEETDDFKRAEKVGRLLADFNNMSKTERYKLYQACLPVVEHNWNYFYSGMFSEILWDELQSILKKLSYD